ncbi:MAG: hypothetical protein ABW128_15490 [Rhizorhabdus sp.]
MTELETLISTLAPALQAAFLAAIARLRAGVNYALLLEALRKGDIDAAIYALNIEPAVFGGYVQERVAAFATAGDVVSADLTRDRAKAVRVALRQSTSQVALAVPRFGFGFPEPVASVLPTLSPAPPPVIGNPITSPVIPPPPPGAPPTLTAPGGGSITFRFDMTNPRAENRIRTEAAARVAGYTAEQKDIARRVIADGFARGEGPQTIATDIAGRIDPVSKRREGGIIGLSDPQVEYVRSMKERLESGDPAELKKVLGTAKGGGMTLRDKRYDATIRKAIKEGKPVPAAKIKEMTAKYSDRLLKRRAEDIARTETASGVEMARAEATRQALEKAGLPDGAVTKRWIHSGGVEHARIPHLVMHDVEVTGIDTPFILPDGSVMQFPHDPEGGARNNVSCRCRGEQDIDWSYGL